ncbi:MAG: DUF5696 domain-containing protein [Anaerolineae bacterium]
MVSRWLGIASTRHPLQPSPRVGAEDRMRRGLLVALLMGLMLAVFSSPVTADDALPPGVPESYQRVAQNDQFELYFDSQTLAFKVLDTRSGYLWHSGVDEALEGDRLNRSWQAFAKSGISIDYFDRKGVKNRISITNNETTIEVTPIEQGVSAQVTFVEYGITVEIVLTLETDGVRVQIPFTSIQETNPDYRLSRVYLYPFMGATRGSSIPGYMFLPDGTGSLIQFADTTRATTMFYGRYYGPDLGMLGVQPYNPRVIPPTPISYPVFGMVHGEGENAFVSFVEQGAAYGELQAHPAGIITNFNFLYHTFIYNDTYFQATNRSGAGVTTVQQQANVFDAVVDYRFLTGEEASYVGMAHSYQRYLQDHNQLRQNDFTNPDIGIRLEFLGGDKEPALLWSRYVPMTSVAQMSEILDGLQVPNPEVIYYGWQPMGALTVPSTSLSIEGALGTVDDLKALTDQITADGGHFSLYLDPLAATWGESGYSTRSDLAMAITDVSLEGYNRFYSYYFTYDALRQRYTGLASNIAARLNVGLALDGISWMAFGDFRQGQELNRQAAVDAYQALLAQSPLRLTFYRPNDYLYSLAQAYFDMPAGDNGYIYTTEPVPFLPIVLAGYVPYYSGALNFSSDRQSDLLRMVEYGMYPSYFLTAEPTANMLNTQSSWIYSSSYDQWGEQIRSTYAWMNELLGPVRGQEIVGHAKVAEGVFTTTYANGRQIIVNYTDQPFARGGVQVGPESASLVEVSP